MDFHTNEHIISEHIISQTQSIKVLEDILRCTREKFFDFSKPNYSFIYPYIGLLRYWNLYNDLVKEFSIKVDIDFNNDICFHYYLDNGENFWKISVFFPEHYAIVTKKLEIGQWQVLNEIDSSSKSDILLFSILKKYYFIILDTKTLKTRIQGFLGKDEDSRIKGNTFTNETLFFIRQHWNLYKDLVNEFSVEESTDFNYDICFHYYLDKEDNSWEVCVSLVGPYTMAIKKLKNSHWQVLDEVNLYAESDMLLISIFKKNGFVILNEKILKTTIHGFHVEDEEGGIKSNAFVYEILFYSQPLNFLGDR
jgi:hypothetical protein